MTTKLTAAQKLQILDELGQTLALCARLTAGDAKFRDLTERMDREYAALARSMRRSAARASETREARLVDAHRRHSASTVSDATRELRAEARRVSIETVTVAAGLRRIVEAETPEPLPYGVRIEERQCSDCGLGFDSRLGSRRCQICSKRMKKRREEDLQRARTRLFATRLSEGWAQVAEEEAATMRRILRRGDR